MHKLIKGSLFSLVVLALAGLVYSSEMPIGSFYFAIEQDGVICGYIKSDVNRTELNRRAAILIDNTVIMNFSALGAEVDTKVKTKTYVDENTGIYFHAEFDAEQGTIQLGGSADIEGDTAILTSRPDGKVEKLALPPDILLENNHCLPHLVRDIIEGGLEEKRYKVLDLMDTEIHEVTYKKIGVEELELAGQKYNAVIFRKMDHTTGLKIDLYINSEDGFNLKTVLPNRTVYLSDETVVDKMAMVSIDDDIIAKVDVAISDYKAITYMKANATLEPGGLWITEKSLNVPGQKFEGTVQDNLVEGIFEVSHANYDGNNAPPFPHNYGDDTAITRYLEPEDMIESDDPVLVSKARELTEGSKDSWDAFRRLSKWVAEEIGYDIPGGGGARNTYDLKLGECGSHSRLLAAFSRAVGIPCRVIWGCMYVPDFGGGFGQHGWNEVYMGEAGWIPVDATAKEIDFVDSGHLRIGVLSSKNSFLNPKKMSILDYQAGDVTMASAGKTDVPEKYRRYIGEYKEGATVFTILVQNQSLAVDIPGKMVFELYDSNDKGQWVFKLTDVAHISFTEIDSGDITGLTLTSKSGLPRKIESEPADVDHNDVPAEYRPYLGKYVVPMQNMDLTVIYQNDNLAVDDPNEGIIQLKGPDDRGEWIDQFDKNKISFDLDETGQASSMIFHSIVKLPKVD